MAKKDIQNAIKEAHDTADKAIDEAQQDIREARKAVFDWLKTERKFSNAELLTVGVGFIATVLILLLL